MNCTVSITTTIRAPLKETMLFVQYYLNEHIDQIYLFFDDPNDPSIPILESNPQVICIRCDKEHWKDVDPNVLSLDERQHYNSRIGLDMARSNNQEWILHLDSDELVYCKKGIKNYLCSLNPSVQVVKFPTLEAVQEKLEYDNVFLEISSFKVAPLQIEGDRIDRYILRLKNIFQTVAKKAVSFCGYNNVNSTNYICGHTLGKSATRTSANISVLGCHYPYPYSENDRFNTVIANNSWLLHFDVLGFDSWCTKCKRRYNGEATSKYMPPRRGQQIDDFKYLYNNNHTGQLKKLYEDLYYLDRKQKFILRLCGLLKTIRLDAKMFEPVE